MEGFFTGADTALKNFVMVGGSPITRGRKLRGCVFFCGVPHVGWKNFLESSGEVENEKEARHVSGGAFMECADQLKGVGHQLLTFDWREKVGAGAMRFG